MNYQEARTILDQKHGNKNSKKLANNTYLLRFEEYIAIKLHDTEIVKLYPDYAQLYTGGWYTMTTKDRINTYALCNVSQVNNIWYIGDFLFYEGIKIDYTGNIISAKKLAGKVEAQNKKIKVKIKNFVALAKKKLKAKKIATPSGGDCWYCVMRTQKKETWGDVSKNDHLLGHMREKYIVPALVYNAIIEAGYGNPDLIFAMRDTMSEGIGRAMTKYMQKRLLIRP